MRKRGEVSIADIEDYFKLNREIARIWRGILMEEGKQVDIELLVREMRETMRDGMMDMANGLFEIARSISSLK